MHRANLIWATNLELTIGAWLESEKDYLLLLHILSSYAGIVLRFIDEAQIKGNVDNETAIMNYVDACRLVADFSFFSAKDPTITNKDFRNIVSAYKRCMGIINAST